MSSHSASPLELPEDNEPIADAVPEPVWSMEYIMTKANELAASDKLDKDSALAMTRLFHALETLLRHECANRDARISKMECDIERTHVQHELDRLTNAKIHQAQLLPSQPTVETPLRRTKSRW